MHNVKSIKSEDLFPAISELLENDQKVRLTVTGDSMMPFLREDTDSVELSPASFKKLRFGQIPLIRGTNGHYILHRVVLKKKNCFYVTGDAQFWRDGPIYPEQLIAVVTKVWRKDRPVSPDSILWKSLSLIWWLRLPAYRVFIKLYRLLKKIFKFAKRGQML